MIKMLDSGKNLFIQVALWKPNFGLMSNCTCYKTFSSDHYQALTNLDESREDDPQPDGVGHLNPFPLHMEHLKSLL